MYTLKVRSHQREELVEFTDEVQKKLTDSGAKEGVVTLYVQHTTAGLTVNENADPDVPRDMLHALRTLIPQHGMGFRHGEENSDAHIKASLVGPSVTIPFAGSFTIPLQPTFWQYQKRTSEAVWSGTLHETSI